MSPFGWFYENLWANFVVSVEFQSLEPTGHLEHLVTAENR